jgi:hypothetical protein
MGAATIAGEGGGLGARPDARRSERTRMMRAAQIAFGGSVVECALLDASPGGVRVFLKAPVDVPDLVALRLPGGESRPSRCRWQTGLIAGFEFVGTTPWPLPAD